MIIPLWVLVNTNLIFLKRKEDFCAKLQIDAIWIVSKNQIARDGTDAELADRAGKS